MNTYVSVEIMSLLSFLVMYPNHPIKVNSNPMYIISVKRKN